MKRQIIIGICVGVAVALATGVAVAVESGSSDPGSESGTAASELTDGFELFATPPEGAEESGLTEGPTDESLGLQSDEAQVVTAEGGTELTAIPGTKGACVDDGYVQGCAPLGAALDNGIVFLEFCGDVPEGQVRVAGIVPDGMDKVELKLPNGGQDVVPVEDNVFSVDRSVAPTAVTPENADSPTLEAPAKMEQTENCG